MHMVIVKYLFFTTKRVIFCGKLNLKIHLNGKNLTVIQMLPVIFQINDLLKYIS
ncbi:hypothetical protein MBBTH_10950 [Methanobrevibacter thaueri]|uniref:Uncharacterized protein n=1 Tax=Methanobrevibacter thaueri TaxID=190975 RepID=A0A315XN63_9EURY|nr:hypothetical protein MBBTH_10950 [Methanobrevibacter thaueri]